MKTTRYIALLLCALTLGAVTSCKVGKKYSRPEMALPERIDSTAALPDTFSVADMHWWTVYTDTILQNLITQTLEHNKDMLAASARIKELAALRRVDISKILPQINGRLYADKDATNYGGDDYSNDPELHARAVLSWEVDLWGKLRWGAERSKAELLEAIENQRALQVSLVAQVAQSYFELIALDHELAIVRQTLRARQEGVRLARLRFEGGLTSETSFQQARVELARTATLVPDLERAIAIKTNEIALLTGTFPREIARQTDRYINRLPQYLPAGLPSALLERRPDVRRAEQELVAANAEVGIALTDMLPRISLTASLGAENDEIPRLLASPYHLISGTLLQPVFAMGKNRARWKAKKAACEQAAYAYEKAVLGAFRDAYNAIAQYNKMNEIYATRLSLEQSSKETMELAQLQYVNGVIGYMDLLDAQRSYLDAQISLSNAIRDKQLMLVNLYKALGGGWK